jgi:hypothetical protein
MRGIPAPIILVLLALSVLMISVGWANHSDVGPIPVIVGVIWALITLGALAGRLRPASR